MNIRVSNVWSFSPGGRSLKTGYDDNELKSLVYKCWPGHIKQTLIVFLLATSDMIRDGFTDALVISRSY